MGGGRRKEGGRRRKYLDLKRKLDGTSDRLVQLQEISHSQNNLCGFLVQTKFAFKVCQPFNLSIG
jgi:hypothetical protein